MRLKLGKWPKLIIVLLALFGVVGALPVSIAEFNQSAKCPSIGPIPICYLVLVGYITIIISTLLLRWNLGVFLIGWLPIFFFALVGSGFEVAGYDTCPKTQSGWPKCYFSLNTCMRSCFTIIFWRGKVKI